jgi:hypothetical protein
MPSDCQDFIGSKMQYGLEKCNSDTSTLSIPDLPVDSNRFCISVLRISEAIVFVKNKVLLNFV